MKAILRTIKPKQCANIMNHIQSILVIKNKREATAIQKLIDENGCADIYVYCSKQSPWIYWSEGVAKINNGQGCILGYKSLRNDNGKVLFKFRCYKVEELEKRRLFDAPFLSEYIYKDNETSYSFERKTQLTEEELCKYLKNKNGYVIHISDLEIFDEPKRLDNFERYGSWRLYQKTCPKALQGRCNHGKGYYVNHCIRAELTKAPQNFCYVEVE